MSSKEPVRHSQSKYTETSKNSVTEYRQVIALLEVEVGGPVVRGNQSGSKK